MTALGKIKNSKTMRALSDMNRVALSGRTQYKVSLVKATNHNKVPPKQKHVLVLLGCHKVKELEYLKENLIKIIHSHDWIRAIKAMQVMHRLIQDSGSSAFADLLSQDKGRWNREQFKDESSGKGMANTQFIRAYARYIDGRTILYNDHPKFRKLSKRLSISKYCKGVSAKNPESLFNILKSLQSLFKDLITCKETSNEVVLENGATLGAFSLILKDSFALYKITTDGIIKLLDLVFSMDKKNAKRALKLYQKHVQLTEDLVELYEFARGCRSIRSSSIPKIKAQPTTLIGSIQEYITNYDAEKKRPSPDNQSVETQQLSEILTEEEMKQLQQSDKKSVVEEEKEDLFVLGDLPKDDSASDTSSMFSFEDLNLNQRLPQQQQQQMQRPQQSNNPFMQQQMQQRMQQQQNYYQNNPFQQFARSRPMPQQNNPFNQFGQRPPVQQNNTFDPFDMPTPPQQQQQQAPPQNNILDDFLSG